MPDGKYCGSPSKYDLCKEHYYDAQEGIIDQCTCGRYKDIEYDVSCKITFT